LGKLLKFPDAWRIDMRENGYDPDVESEIDKYMEDFEEDVGKAIAWYESTQKEVW
jgi:hypothetical protein